MDICRQDINTIIPFIQDRSILSSQISQWPIMTLMALAKGMARMHDWDGEPLIIKDTGAVVQADCEGL